MLPDLSSLQSSCCAPCWHPRWLLLPPFLSEISLSRKKKESPVTVPQRAISGGQGQLILNAPFRVDGDIPTHAASTWWLTVWVLPKQPLCGPVVSPISGAQGAAVHHRQEIIAVTAAADTNGTARASERFSGGQRQPGLAGGGFALEKHGDFRRQMLLIQSHRLTATRHEALGMLSKCCLSTVPSAWLMKGTPTAPSPQRLPKFASLCYLCACSSGADAGMSAEALILFILWPKLGHQCCQVARFFGLIHTECIFNTISAVLSHWTPMWCITAVRALQ